MSYFEDDELLVKELVAGDGESETVRGLYGYMAQALHLFLEKRNELLDVKNIGVVTYVKSRERDQDYDTGKKTVKTTSSVYLVLSFDDEDSSVKTFNSLDSFVENIKADFLSDNDFYSISNGSLNFRSVDELNEAGKVKYIRDVLNKVDNVTEFKTEKPFGTNQGEAPAKRTDVFNVDVLVKKNGKFYVLRDYNALDEHFSKETKALKDLHTATLDVKRNIVIPLYGKVKQWGIELDSISAQKFSKVINNNKNVNLEDGEKRFFVNNIKLDSGFTFKHLDSAITHGKGNEEKEKIVDYVWKNRENLNFSSDVLASYLFARVRNKQVRAKNSEVWKPICENCVEAILLSSDNEKLTLNGEKLWYEHFMSTQSLNGDSWRGALLDDKGIYQNNWTNLGKNFISLIREVVKDWEPALNINMGIVSEPVKNDFEVKLETDLSKFNAKDLEMVCKDVVEMVKQQMPTICDSSDLSTLSFSLKECLKPANVHEISKVAYAKFQMRKLEENMNKHMGDEFGDEPEGANNSFKL